MTNGTSYKLLMARIVTLMVVGDIYYIIFFSNCIITSLYNLSTFGSQNFLDFSKHLTGKVVLLLLPIKHTA